jgi:tetratricopeptide (TPR) repeat protein
VPDDRQPPPQKPFALSIQASFRQDAAAPQFVSYGPTPALQQDDAETWYKRANALREQRQFGEALASFDRTIALKPDHAEAHNGRGIVLAGLQRFAEAIAAFDRAITLKPDYAEAYNNRGLILQDVNRVDDALASFDKAVALKPGEARMQMNRGAVLEDLKRFEDAIGCYDRAVALRPDYADAYNNRGLALQNLNRMSEALGSFDKAIELRRDYAEAYSNRAVVLQDLNRLDAAVADFDKAIALRPDFAEAASNQGYCLLKTGRFARGWRLHEWRKRVARPVGNRALARPLWLGGEDTSNATVFVHYEQGLGDTIQFCRYGKLLAQRAARVVMSVQEPLHALLKQMNPAIEIIAGSAVPGAFDYHCPLMSLPLAFGTTLQTIPSERRYIVSDEVLRKSWNARLPPATKKRIGLVWRGNPTHRNDHNRSVDLAAFAPLFATEAQWVSLQKGLTPSDAGFFAPRPNIARLGDELRDFADTAAVIEGFDLVIAVDTGVAHLAGAMGKPVWILLPFNADWRWLTDRDDSPWYPTARLFRQEKAGSWDDVIARLGRALSDFVRSPS